MIPWLSIIIIITIAMCTPDIVAPSVVFLGRKIDFNLKICIVFCIMLLFRALRMEEVGGDLVQYRNLFYRVGSLSWVQVLTVNSGYEPLFLLLNKALYLVFPQFQIMIIFTAVVNTTALFWFSFRYSPNPWLALYIYVAFGFWGTSFNNERQAIAVGLLLISVKFIEERQLKKFLLIVILASFIHGTSALFLIMYFIYGKRFRFREFVMSVIIGTITYVASNQIIVFVLRKIPFYYAKYGEVDWISGQGYTYFFILILLSFSVIVLFPFSEENDIITNFFIYMLIFSTILQVFSLQLAYFQRIVKVFAISMIVYIPLAITKLDDPYYRFLAKSLVVIVLGGWFITSLVHDSISLVPYKWIISIK